MLSFLAVVGVLMLLASTSQPLSTPYEPGKPRLPFPGTEVSLDTAQGMVSFRIGVPSYLPHAFSYTSVRVDPTYPAGGLVYLIYSPVPIVSNTTMDSLLAAGGFFVVEDHEPATDPGPIIDAVVREHGATEVTINGSPGFYAGNQVHWWATGIHYAIVSPLSEADMLAIANSVAS